MGDKIVVEICDNCEHQAFITDKGVVCGLTNDKPKYETSCELFEGVPSKVQDYLWKQRKEQKDKLTSQVRLILTIVLVLSVIIIFYLIWRKFDSDMGKAGGGAIRSIFN